MVVAKKFESSAPSSTRGGFGFFRWLGSGQIAGESGRKGETDVHSEETQIGQRVRVRKDHRTTSWCGQEGTITKRWGDPTYTALDVLLDDGRSELFWHHELEEIAARA